VDRVFGNHSCSDSCTEPHFSNVLGQIADEQISCAPFHSSGNRRSGADLKYRTRMAAATLALAKAPGPLACNSSKSEAANTVSSSDETKRAPAIRARKGVLSRRSGNVCNRQDKQHTAQGVLTKLSTPIVGEVTVSVLDSTGPGSFTVDDSSWTKIHPRLNELMYIADADRGLRGATCGLDFYEANGNWVGFADAKWEHPPAQTRVFFLNGSP
jgi:hypothetical protein